MCIKSVKRDSMISCPPRALNFSLCNFYPWDKLKGRIYSNNLRTLEELHIEYIYSVLYKTYFWTCKINTWLAHLGQCSLVHNEHHNHGTFASATHSSCHGFRQLCAGKHTRYNESKRAHVWVKLWNQHYEERGRNLRKFAESEEAAPTKSNMKVRTRDVQAVAAGFHIL